MEAATVSEQQAFIFSGTHQRKADADLVSPSPTEVDEDLDFEKQSAEALHIYPISLEAVLAFDLLCQDLDTQPPSEESMHYSQFVFRDSSISTVREAAGHFEDVASSDDEHSLGQVLDKKVHTGHWVLSYAVPPSRSPMGWRWGYGKSMTGPVDFHIPRDIRWQGLRGFHATIKLDDQGQLYFEALRNGVKLNGDSMRPKETRNLSKVVQRFSIADVLDYEIRYACPEHLRSMQKGWRTLYMQNNLLKDDPHVHVPITPAEYTTQRGDWMTGSIIGRGGHAAGGGRTVIRAGTHCRRSQVVAVKDVFYTNHQDWTRVVKEISTYKRVDAAIPRDSEHRDLILTLLETVPSKLPDFVLNENDSIALILSPLGIGDFSSIVNIAYGERLRLFASTLCAVDLMHRHRIVHRDIKLSNICIQESKRALIVDWASARILDPYAQLLPSPGSCGTIGFLAPELENPSYSSSGRYDIAVDIWSLGASACDIFSDILPCKIERTYKHRNPFRERDDESAEARAERSKVCQAIEEAVRTLKTGLRFTLENLIGKMLEVRPENRITAHDALQHPSLEQAISSYRRSVTMSRKRMLGQD